MHLCRKIWTIAIQSSTILCLCQYNNLDAHISSTTDYTYPQLSTSSLCHKKQDMSSPTAYSYPKLPQDMLNARSRYRSYVDPRKEHPVPANLYQHTDPYHTQWHSNPPDSPPPAMTEAPRDIMSYLAQSLDTPVTGLRQAPNLHLFDLKRGLSRDLMTICLPVYPGDKPAPQVTIIIMHNMPGLPTGDAPQKRTKIISS